MSNNSETIRDTRKMSMNHAINVKTLFQIPSTKPVWNAPSGEITLTSYPACNKTSLSRKACIPDKKLLWIAIRKSWSLFQNPSSKIAWTARWRRNQRSISSQNKMSNSLEMVWDTRNMPMNDGYKTESATEPNEQTYICCCIVSDSRH